MEENNRINEIEKTAGETADEAEDTEMTVAEETAAEETAAEETATEETAAEETAVEENVIEENGIEENVTEETVEEKVGEEKAVEEKVTETAEDNGEEAAQKKPRKKRVKKTEEPSEEEEALPKPDCPEAAIEAVLFATGNSVPIEQLADILNMKQDEVRAAIANLKERYESEDRGITITELEDAVQLGTKGEYYEYLMKLAKHPKHYSLSDTVIETLSIIAYKQPVTRGEIEKIRGVSCDHALNKLLEYDLIEEVGRLDAPGKPLLFGTTEQFLRSFGVKSIGELPTVSPEMVEDFKVQAEAEAAEDLALENIKVDV